MEQKGRDVPDVRTSALSGVSALQGLSALSGVSALLGLSALPGPSALPGQSFHSAAIHGDTPWMWKWGRPPRLPGLAGPKEHFHSGYPYPARGPALPLGSQATPGCTVTPKGPGNFHGLGNCQPSGRHHPSTVNDAALSGHSALPGLSTLPGLSALPGQSSHSAAIHGDTPLEVEIGPALAGPLAHRSCRTN